MKKLCLFLMLVGASVILRAQGKTDSTAHGSKVVAAASVPDAVKAPQTQQYAGIVVTQWKTHTGKKGKKEVRYIADFKDKTGVKTEATYEADGKKIATSRFYHKENLPAVITKAEARYPGYHATAVEEIVKGKSGKLTYEVKLKSTSGKKTVKLNASGAEIVKKAKTTADDNQ